jgi:hypothetical protein
MSRVTMKALSFDRASFSPVLAKIVKKSAMPPLVTQSLEPLRRKWSSFSTAWVLIDAASLPASGSVRQKAAMSSPLARGS